MEHMGTTVLEISHVQGLTRPLNHGDLYAMKTDRLAYLLTCNCIYLMYLNVTRIQKF